MTIYATQPVASIDRKNKAATLADGSVVLLTPYLFEAVDLLWRAKAPVPLVKLHNPHQDVRRLRRLGIGLDIRRGIGYVLQRAAA